MEPLRAISSPFHCAQWNIVLRYYTHTGTDTTAITATYATYCLSTRPDIQEALIREVSTLPAEFQDEDLRQLKLLNGVINETLRLHGAVGQGLPRLAPPGGATLCGYYVPETVTVGVQAYSIHHDEGLWPNANEFRPDRWFEDAKEMCHRDFEPLSPHELDRQFTSMLMGDATCSWESDEQRTRMRWMGKPEDRDKSLGLVAQVMPGKVVLLL